MIYSVFSLATAAFTKDIFSTGDNILRAPGRITQYETSTTSSTTAHNMPFNFQTGDTFIILPNPWFELLVGDLLDVTWIASDPYLKDTMVEIGLYKWPIPVMNDASDKYPDFYTANNETVIKVEVDYNKEKVQIPADLLSNLPPPSVPTETGGMFYEETVTSTTTNISEYPDKYIVVMKGQTASLGSDGRCWTKGGLYDCEYGPNYAVAQGEILYRIKKSTPKKLVDLDFKELEDFEVKSRPSLDFAAMVLSYSVGWDSTDMIGHEKMFKWTVKEEPQSIGTWKIEWGYSVGTEGVSILSSKVDNVLAVVFRATIGDKVLLDKNQDIFVTDDWRLDMDMRSAGCTGLIAHCDEDMTVHRGFLYEYLVNKEDIRRNVVNALTNYELAGECENAVRLLVTGFSQGAGIAPIAAFDLVHYLDDYEKEHPSSLPNVVPFLITGGTPPIGNITFAKAVQTMLPKENRERYVMSFRNGSSDSNQQEPYSVMVGIFPNEDVDDKYFNTKDIIHNIFSKSSIQIGKMTNIGKCVNSIPPKDANDIRLWEKNDGAVAWYNGDLVAMLQVDCRPHHQASVEWNMLYNRGLVQNPSMIHQDSDYASYWPDDDHPDKYRPISYPFGSKGPYRLYNQSKDPKYMHWCDHTVKSDDSLIITLRSQIPWIDNVLNLFSCHDVVLYTHSVSKLTNELQGRNFGSIDSRPTCGVYQT